jgi:pilus assembly protein CpaF
MEPFLAKELPVLLIEAFQNPQITDICINGFDKIFCDQGEGLIRLESQFESHSSLMRWVLDLFSFLNKSWDASFPFVDGMLSSGHRIHVVLPPVSGNQVFLSFRRVFCQGSLLWEKDPYFSLICSAFQKKASILIAGACGAGKTTLAACLIEKLPFQERILAIEDVSELFCSHPQFLSLVTRTLSPDGFGAISASQLIKQSLRMRPDRIVLGECRGEEVLDFLQILNTGHPGALCTVHANSAADALKRIELLSLLNSKNLSSQAIRLFIAMGVHWVVFVEQKKIKEVYQVSGIEEGIILMRSMLASGRSC